MRFGISHCRTSHGRATGSLLLALLVLGLLTTAGHAQRGLLDDIPEKGLQKVTPRSEPPPSRPAEQPIIKDERLRLPDRPSNNYDFLEGCWVSDAFKHSPAHPEGTSTYCFDASGRGTLVFQSPRATCRVAATARFQGGLLKMSDSDGRCTDQIFWSADHLDCERGADGVAACKGFSKDQATGEITKWTVTFRRQAGSRRPGEPKASNPRKN